MSRTAPLLKIARHKLTDFSSNVGAGNDIVMNRKNVRGHARVIGHVIAQFAPAAGFPRLEWSKDGINWNYITELTPDPSQTIGLQWVCNIPVRLPYVQFRFTNGANLQNVNGFLEATPEDEEDGGIIPGGLVGAKNASQLVRSVSTVDFIAAIPVNQDVAAELPGLLRNGGVIEGMTLISKENLDWEVAIWSSATHGPGASGIDGDTFLGSVVLRAGDATAILNDDSALYHYSLHDLAIDYLDADGGNELHLSLIPRSAAKTVGAAGAVVVQVAFRPDGP